VREAREISMPIQPTFLLIADIAGYTRFMKFHRAGLAHAPDIVAQLLEAMIDAPKITMWARLARHAGLAARTLPEFFGLEDACIGFRTIDRTSPADAAERTP
jgi:hypothetical protein